MSHTLHRRLVTWMSVAVCGFVVAGCGSALSARRASSSHRLTSGVLLRGLTSPQAYAADGDLYVIQRVIPPANQLLSELMRVDQRSGRVDAVRLLGSGFDQALLARGVLWVTTSRRSQGWLWRLDPRSLTVLSRQVLPGSAAFSPFGTMALAGGWLWIGSGGRLLRFSLPTGHMTADRPLPAASVVDVAANSAGRVLLVSEGGEISHVQRRDPRTGKLMASSRALTGAGPPYIGGIVDGWVWISQSGGMMGSVERLALTTLAPSSFPGAVPQPGVTGAPSIFGTNGITAQLIDGVLWVSQFAGGPTRNYCGSPITGRAHARLPLAKYGLFLTADAGTIYYIANANLPKGEELVRTRISPRCYAVHRVLRSGGVGRASFGDRPSTVTRLLDNLLGRPPNRSFHTMSLCRVDGAIDWPGLSVDFVHERFVGYQYWPASRAGQPDLTTTRGLDVGDPVARARQIYGRVFETSAAQGGSWLVPTAHGRLYGYLSGPPIRGPHIEIASIGAGYVGCPGVTP